MFAAAHIWCCKVTNTGKLHRFPCGTQPCRQGKPGKLDIRPGWDMGEAEYDQRVRCPSGLVRRRSGLDARPPSSQLNDRGLNRRAASERRHPGRSLSSGRRWTFLGAQSQRWTSWTRPPANPLAGGRPEIADRAPGTARSGHHRVGRGGRDRGRRRADRRPVDDQHRHRRHRRHRGAGGPARPRRLGTRAHHRRPRRGGRRGAEDPRAPRPHRRARAPGGRLPLHRPQAPLRPSSLRRGAGQVPDQPRERRLQGKKDTQFSTIIEQAIRYGKTVRIGANWGSPRRGAPHPPHGRERQVAPAHRRTGSDARGHGAVGPHLGRARRGTRPAEGPDHPVRQGPRRCRISSRSTARGGAPLRFLRSISASRKPAWARRAWWRPPPPSACSSKRASATRSATR